MSLQRKKNKKLRRLHTTPPSNEVGMPFMTGQWPDRGLGKK
jgi:hypothetical protein